MPMAGKSEIVCALEQKIKEGKRIFLLDQHDAKLLGLLCKGLKEHDLLDAEVWHCMDEASGYCRVQRISRKEMDEVREMYLMYDFSDRVSIISNPAQYGSLFNYLENGVITAEDMMEALLVTN